MGRAWSRNARDEECIQDNGGKARRKETTGRPQRRCVDNIKIDVREVGWDDVGWIDLAQDRDQWRALVNTVMKTSGSLKCWDVPEWLHNWQLLRKVSAP
jgi:hypothetical protein